MKISLNWVKDYINFSESTEQVADLLTNSGLEVEGVEAYQSIKGGLKGLIIGEVIECSKHPNADRLSLTKVKISKTKTVPIVCGAPNVAAGQKVIVAPVGSTIQPAKGEAFKINKAKIRGQVSEGMVCAEDEIGLGTSHDGIMVLDTTKPAGTKVTELFESYEDDVLEIGLTPNRADATSHFGVARELQALIGKKAKLPNVEKFKHDNTERPVTVEIKNTEACPRYAGLTISGLTVKPSPQWLQNRLKAIGLSPINNVVDVTNYVLHELGQPLHAFDLNEVKGNKIIVKTAKEGEKFVTLDEAERKLSKNDLMICNSKDPMCIAGVFGGLHSGVKESTTAIFLESAYFSPDYIRKTAQTHALKTDASFRFERGTDPNMVIVALKRAALLIKEVAGGKITSKIVDEYPNKIKDFNFKVSLNRINTLIGEPVSAAKIKKILKDLDIEIKSEKKDILELAVPPYRVDVQREADIVEEILRIYGYNNISISENPGTSYVAEFPKKSKEFVVNELATLLEANGYNEIINNSLTKPAFSSHLNGAQSQAIEILNKLSDDLAVMRQSLLFSGLEVISYNINRKQANVKVFEVGKTYHKKGKDYIENERVSILISGDKKEESWQSPSKPADVYDMIGIITKINERFGLSVDQEERSDHIFQQGMSCKVGNKTLMHFGVVQKKLAKQFDIKQPVFYADIDLGLLVDLYTNEMTYQEISKFPEVRRDLSLVLDRSVKYDTITKLALKTEKKLIKNINAFDVYEGDKISKDKKAYALSFILQDHEQTLTDDIIDATMNKLIKAFEQDLKAVIRK